MLILTAACRKKPEYSSFAGAAQGTTYSIIFEKKPGIDPLVLREEAEILLHDFDMSLSLYEDSSVLCRLNRNENVKPDRFFTDAFRRSKEISDLTGGAFDITVGPLVRAWGFGPDGNKDFTPSGIDSLLQLVGMQKVELRDGNLWKADPRITLDLNAIAQGYSVDVVCGFLEKKGVNSFLVEIGGEVRVEGDKGGSLWTIGIDRPVDYNVSPGSDLKAVIRMKDRALATSGNYRKFYIENGIKYSHTIDPKTGYPAKNQLLSATILASDCAAADGIATACMVMGKEKSIEFLDLHPEYDGYLIYSDDSGNFRTWMTERLKGYIEEE
ncbi:MAG: FAD:protein FMN transferase [Bacteroidales bacterium]|jgi:thiamine biosynthesis lipoprotein|nr:FAD:protein FMN transferase [Bacteroidales bacterium]